MKRNWNKSYNILIFMAIVSFFGCKKNSKDSKEAEDFTKNSCSDFKLNLDEIDFKPPSIDKVFQKDLAIKSINISENPYQFIAVSSPSTLYIECQYKKQIFRMYGNSGLFCANPSKQGNHTMQCHACNDLSQDKICSDSLDFKFNISSQFKMTPKNQEACQDQNLSLENARRLVTACADFIKIATPLAGLKQQKNLVESCKAVISMKETLLSLQATHISSIALSLQKAQEPQSLGLTAECVDKMSQASSYPYPQESNSSGEIKIEPIGQSDTTTHPETEKKNPLDGKDYPVEPELYYYQNKFSKGPVILAFGIGAAAGGLGWFAVEHGVKWEGFKPKGIQNPITSIMNSDLNMGRKMAPFILIAASIPIIAAGASNISQKKEVDEIIRKREEKLKHKLGLTQSAHSYLEAEEKLFTELEPIYDTWITLEKRAKERSRL